MVLKLLCQIEEILSVLNGLTESGDDRVFQRFRINRSSPSCLYFWTGRIMQDLSLCSLLVSQPNNPTHEKKTLSWKNSNFSVIFCSRQLANVFNHFQLSLKFLKTCITSVTNVNSWYDWWIISGGITHLE